MKKGWQITTLGDLCVLTSGGTPSKNNPRFWVGNVPFVSARDLKSDRIETALLHISREAVEQSATKVAPVGSLLMLVRGMGLANGIQIGEVTSTVAFNQDIRALHPPLDSVLPRFLLLALRNSFLNGEGERVLSSAAHGTLKIDADVLRQIAIPLPPLPEQKRIVGILDEAFDGIAIAKAKAEKNLQNARAIFESHLQSVFTQRGEGWVVRKVAEIAKHSLGKMLDKAKNRGAPQPYLRNINVRWFGVDLSDVLEMRFLPEEAEKYTAIKGDVLVCEGGYPGRAAIWEREEPIYFQKALHRVRFHEPEHNKWFVYFLYAQGTSGELKQHFSGTGIQHFTGEVLARFQIPLPPSPELRRAVALFDDLSAETQRLARLYERKLHTLEALKKSLLHEAFTGKL